MYMSCQKCSVNATYVISFTVEGMPGYIVLCKEHFAAHPEILARFKGEFPDAYLKYPYNPVKPPTIK